MFPEEDINHSLMGGQGCPDLQRVITTKPNHETHTRECCFAVYLTLTKYYYYYFTIFYNNFTSISHASIHFTLYIRIV